MPAAPASADAADEKATQLIDNDDYDQDGYEEDESASQKLMLILRRYWVGITAAVAAVVALAIIVASSGPKTSDQESAALMLADGQQEQIDENEAQGEMDGASSLRGEEASLSAQSSGGSDKKSENPSKGNDANPSAKDKSNVTTDNKTQSDRAAAEKLNAEGPSGNAEGSGAAKPNNSNNDSGANGNNNNAAETPQPVIYTTADVGQLPQFPGGEAAMYEWLSQVIQYPAVAAEEQVSGRVTVEFIISPTGDIEQLRVLRGRHPALDKEALRVVGLMPKWVPGRHDGKPVSVKYILPITFKLQ